MLCSRKTAVRRTGTYRYSGSLRVARVRAPQITIPEAGKERMTLTPIGFSTSWAASVVSATSPTAPPTFAAVPAGAFQTPRVASVRAYRPMTKPEGGTGTGVAEIRAGSEIRSQG